MIASTRQMVGVLGARLPVIRGADADVLMEVMTEQCRRVKPGPGGDFRDRLIRIDQQGFGIFQAHGVKIFEK